MAETVEISSPAYGIARELAKQIPSASRVRAYLLTDGLLSSRAKDWPEGEIAGIPIEFHIWDIARFHRMHTSKAGRDDLTIDLAQFAAGGIPCLKAARDSDGYDAYLCVIPGHVLATIYEEFGSRLLEGNVRSFLTTRGRVNKGIRSTLLNDPDMFFAYNNGIAATASDVRTAISAGGLVLMEAKDLQIVNGGQTTASLASALRNDRASLESVHVPMKLSVVGPERSGEMIPLISRFANTQNRVSEADFFSNHEFHRRLEEISRRIWAPAAVGSQHETHWFYERTRGQYMNETTLLTPSARRQFERINPRGQVINKTDLAKSENCWRGLPHVVSRGAQKNFLEFANHIAAKWDSDPNSFHENYWRAAVARVIVFRATERLVSNQAWYSGGYRANVVAYAVARLGTLVEERAEHLAIDLAEVWKSQSLSPALTNQLAVIARAMHEVITDPPAGIENVTEWSKKESCWERAKRRGIDLLPELADALVPEAAIRASDHEARAQQKQDSGISDQAEVVRLGRDYWDELLRWARTEFPLSPEDDRLVAMAARTETFVPTERQAARMLELKDRLEREGLHPPQLPLGGA
jgi:hypothetical protein